jgi:hypothetical protein
VNNNEKRKLTGCGRKRSWPNLSNYPGIFLRKWKCNYIYFNSNSNEQDGFVTPNFYKK